MGTVLKTVGLTKRFGSKTAVDAVNINIEKGDIYGFIGKNGAGKTTAMRMILGMANVSEGSIELFGRGDLGKERKRVGALIESPGLYLGCTAYENMKRFSILYGGTDEEIKEILKLVGLADTGKKKVGHFSLGMKQRLGIALAMLGNPEFMVLDEPIVGLDPEGIKMVRDAVLRLNQEKGVTFMIASHLLDELSKIATKYGIIRAGKLVEEISAEELNNRCAGGVRIKTTDNAAALAYLQTIYPPDKLIEKNGFIGLFINDEPVPKVNKTLVEAGFEVEEIAKHTVSFENYFIARLG